MVYMGSVSNNRYNNLFETCTYCSLEGCFENKEIVKSINTYSLLLVSPELTLSSTPLSMSVSRNIGFTLQSLQANFTFVRIIMLIFMKCFCNDRFDVPQVWRGL